MNGPNRMTDYGKRSNTNNGTFPNYDEHLFYAQLLIQVNWPSFVLKSDRKPFHSTCVQSVRQVCITGQPEADTLELRDKLFLDECLQAKNTTTMAHSEKAELSTQKKKRKTEGKRKKETWH